MMIMGNFKKMYIGAIEQEKEAALLYDRIAIMVHGLKVSLISKINRWPIGQNKLWLYSQEDQIFSEWREPRSYTASHLANGSLNI